jgi:signal transduction histidine kinase
MRAAVKPWGPSRWGVRRRSVITAVVVVGAALAVGSAVLLWLLQSALVSTARDGVLARAQDLSTLLAEQGVGEARQNLRDSNRPGEDAQVLDSAGRVVAASDDRLTAPLSMLRPGPGQSADLVLQDLPALGDTDDYLVGAVGVLIDGEPFVVQVAAPVQVQTNTIQTVALFVLGAIPLILVLVGVSVWALVGRSLLSVERIRQQVATIDSQRLAERVEVPPTGDEIASLATTMNTMLGRLDASDQAQKAFFSDASHELRSPLSTLVTTAEVASADPTGRTWVQTQSTIVSETKRMQFLVEDLLTLAKADSQALVRRLAEVDLEDVLDREIRRLRTLTSHRLVVDLEPARVRGDADRLAQVFRNVFDNAVRHAASSVAVSTVLDDHVVRVRVDNDGSPIDVAQRERVFERFVRLDESRSRDGGGSGLGLAISAAIMRVHGGTIVTTDTPSGWCRFEITLPLIPW